MSKSGPQLAHTMRNETDFSPVIRTMLSDQMVASEEEARDHIDAFLQWVALVPSIRAQDALVMLKTPVDDVFHAFVLNTEFYQRFCETHFGFFVHHHPLDAETRERLAKGVVETVERLERTYGEDLHPLLRSWRGLMENEAYVVSCGKCDSSESMTDTIVGRLPNGGALVH